MGQEHLVFEVGGRGSTSHTTTSASASAAKAASTRLTFKASLGAITPGVSRKRSWAPARCTTPRSLCRVVWGLGK